jgi:carbamoylphosphate synthase large subunit
MAKILVTGVGSPAGRSLASQLCQRGHVVIGTDMRAVDGVGTLIYLAPAAHQRAFVPELRQIVAEEKIDLIIPTVDEELAVLAQHWQSQSPPVVVGPLAAVQVANDRFWAHELLSAQGVSVPRYALPSQLCSPNDVTERVGWPCVSKPRAARGGHSAIVYTPAKWESLARLDDRFIVQEFVPGVDYTASLYLAQHRQSARSGACGCRTQPSSGAGPLAETNHTAKYLQNVVVVLEKNAPSPGQTDHAIVVQRVDAPDIAALALAAGQALDLCGPIDVAIRRRTDGAPVVLEINAHFGANSAHSPEVLDALLAAYGVTPVAL